MNDAYCSQLHRKLEDWQKQHGQFDVVVGIETEGIRIGYRLAQMMDLPFHIMPHKRTELEQLGPPALPADTHWLSPGASVVIASDSRRRLMAA